MLEKANLFCLISLITLLLLMWKWMGLGKNFSSKLDSGYYIFSIAKTTLKKIGALIRSVKFLSRELALDFYKSTIRTSMEYCFHVRVGAPSCYLAMFDKLQKKIYQTVGPSLTASLKPLDHCLNVTRLKELWNYNQKWFLCPIQKYAKKQATL